MRLLAVALATLAALIVANAEEYATTEGGRRILLRDNGTWVEVPATRSPSVAPDADRNVEQIIKLKCQGEWPTDFRMQAYCERQQREGVQTLAQGRPQDIQQNQFSLIRQKCNGEWPNDFRMRAYCERQQYEAVRQLRR
jgi:hypothetical protein